VLVKESRESGFIAGSPVSRLKKPGFKGLVGRQGKTAEFTPCVTVLTRSRKKRGVGEKRGRLCLHFVKKGGKTTHHP